MFREFDFSSRYEEIDDELLGDEDRFSLSDFARNIRWLPRTGSESQKIRQAIAQGIRDENRLTNMVFFTRYPERQRRKLKRSEINFKSLAQEWLAIRNQKVRPALAVANRQPRSSPSRTSPNTRPSGGSPLLRRKIIKLANQEWRRWRKGKIKEGDWNIRSVLDDYWRTGVGWRPRGERWWSDTAWSAAFISWIMRQAGAGNAFKYSAAHANYIKAAKDNRLAGNQNPFKAYRIREVKPEPGDLVCKTRGSRRATYDNIKRGYTTHCDIVTAVQPGQLITIGGNVSDSVSRTRVPTDANGYIKNPKYFAVVKLMSLPDRQIAAGSPVTAVPIRSLRRTHSQTYDKVDRESGLGTIRAIGKIYESLRRRAGISDRRGRQLIRLGSKQLDAANQPVTGAGTGRRLTKPDISYVDIYGRRVNIEVDTDTASSARHQTHVNAADGRAINYFLIIDPWTGTVLQANKRTPGRGTRPLMSFRQSRLPPLAV